MWGTLGGVEKVMSSILNCYTLQRRAKILGRCIHQLFDLSCRLFQSKSREKQSWFSATWDVYQPTWATAVVVFLKAFPNQVVKPKCFINFINKWVLLHRHCAVLWSGNPQESNGLISNVCFSSRNRSWVQISADWTITPNMSNQSTSGCTALQHARATVGLSCTCAPSPVCVNSTCFNV